MRKESTRKKKLQSQLLAHPVAMGGDEPNEESGIPDIEEESDVDLEGEEEEGEEDHPSKRMRLAKMKECVHKMQELKQGANVKETLKDIERTCKVKAPQNRRQRRTWTHQQSKMDVAEYIYSPHQQ